MARQLEKFAQKFNYTFFWCYGPLMWYFPPNNTGFDECWGYCISCKVDISIFHRNKGRACCIDGAWHAITTTWLSVTAKGLSSRMVSTACGPDPLVRADDSQQTFNRLTFRDLDEGLVVLGYVLLIKSVLASHKTTRDRCMKIASKDPEKRWSVLQGNINTTKPEAKQLTCVILQL